jgi:hypothetical protein
MNNHMNVKSIKEDPGKERTRSSNLSENWFSTINQFKHDSILSHTAKTHSAVLG